VEWKGGALKFHFSTTTHPDVEGLGRVVVEFAGVAKGGGPKEYVSDQVPLDSLVPVPLPKARKSLNKIPFEPS